MNQISESLPEKRTATMAISVTSRLIVALFTITTLTTAATAISGSDLVSELFSLQSRSDSGVIRLNDKLLARLLTATKTPRPFSLLIFFDAVQLRGKSELQLEKLRSEFALLASTFISNNADDPSSRSKLFFCDIEFGESQATFAQFGVNSLPHIRLVPTTAANLKDETPQMSPADYARLAESMAEFVESKTQLTVGPIIRPPILSKKQIGFLLLVLLASLPLMVKKVIAGETLLHVPMFWLIGAVFVYFFSVSGAMFNIIRNMPMFTVDQNDPSKMVFFYQGSGMQLGAEGFTIGFLYTIVGLLLAMSTHLLVKVRNQTVQRVFMLIALVVSFWAVKKVVVLDNWKTGYGIHGYWPSSWN